MQARCNILKIPLFYVYETALLNMPYIDYQLDAPMIIYSPLHVSSLKCSSSGGYSCTRAAYGTVIL